MSELTNEELLEFAEAGLVAYKDRTSPRQDVLQASLAASQLVLARNSEPVSVGVDETTRLAFKNFGDLDHYELVPKLTQDDIKRVGKE